MDERYKRTTGDLEKKLATALYNGSLVAHGAHEAVSGGGPDVLDAARAFLGTAAAKVFDRYLEAPHQADSGLAEKFLKTPLDRIAAADDPLSLITRVGGRAQIKTDHKAIVSLCDYLGQNGQVEGRRLLDHFSASPFGWSKDTVRYLLAAAFLGSEIKLRIAGKDHQVKDDESLAAFTSNKSLGSAGIALRQEKADPEACLRASERLQNLSGDSIMPLEDEIATAAKKHFPVYQSAFAPLAVELRSFDLTKPEQADRLENLTSDLAEILSGDGSDAVKRLGGVDSPLYDSLVWARKLKKALDNGLRVQLSHLRRLRLDIEGLPDSGLPAMLKDAAADSLGTIDDILSRESFFDDAASLGTAAAELDKLVVQTVSDLAGQQANLAALALSGWQASPDWSDLGEDDRTSISASVAALSITSTGDLDGLKKLINHEYSLNHRLRELGEHFSARAKKCRDDRDAAAKQQETEPPAGNGAPQPKEELLFLPKALRTAEELESLISQLNEYLVAIRAGSILRIKYHLLDEPGRSSGGTYL